MPLHLEFYGFSGEVEGKRGANGEFFGALQGTVGKRLDIGIVKEIFV